MTMFFFIHSLSSPARNDCDLRLFIRCVFSACGPGVRVMLLGLTADQSVHCSSVDQLGPESVCCCASSTMDSVSSSAPIETPQTHDCARVGHLDAFCTQI